MVPSIQKVVLDKSTFGLVLILRFPCPLLEHAGLYFLTFDIRRMYNANNATTISLVLARLSKDDMDMDTADQCPRYSILALEQDILFGFPTEWRREVVRLPAEPALPPH